MTKTLILEDTFLNFDPATGIIELRSNDSRLPANRLKLSISANTESYRALYELLRSEGAIGEESLPPAGTLRVVDATELGIPGTDPRPNVEIGMASDSVPVQLDLTSNLLVGGATGSGKSIAIRNILAYGLTNDHVQLVAIDMKQVEFRGYGYREEDILATNLQDAMVTLRLLEDIVDKRWSQINAIGLDHYLETDLPAIYLLIDEIGGILPHYSGNTREELEAYRMGQSIERSLWILSSSLGRDAGIHTVIGAQDPRGIPQRIRREIGTEILMGAAYPEMTREIFGEPARYGSVYLKPRGRGVLHRDDEQTLFQSYFIPYDAYKRPQGPKAAA